VTASALRAQEAGHAAEGGHSGEAAESDFRSYVGFFGGLATHTERDETGGAMGVSYSYVLSHRWAVGVKLEYSTSRLERDLLFVPAVAFEALDRLEFVLGVGVERADKDEEERTEREIEGVVRLGVAYIIPLREGVHVGPEFNADIGGSRVTYVYGVGMAVGL
jgi:hypothetical protein